ncbi:hypothetical protein BJ508DRAFT_336026 [Ascobolus immersus RN42]|uniref:Uncharacterized protein n=1 Tax=Ascobolus immersus RN42 TaxID=1160509 RepID=A0A3N4HP50_ASCIM|nr:hypothetical protein BJ508DRAFT_336026 [Ascobolus immersus RN42]
MATTTRANKTPRSSPPQPRTQPPLHISDEISETLDKTLDDISISFKHQQYRVEDTINYQHYLLHTVLDKATKGKAVELIKPADWFERLPIPFWLKFIPDKQGDGEESLLMMNIGIDKRMTKLFDDEVVEQVLHQGQAAVHEDKLHRDQEKMEKLIAALNRKVVLAHTVKGRLEKGAGQKRQVQRLLDTYGRTTSDNFLVLYDESSHWGDGPLAREYMKDLRETPRWFEKEYERKLKWVEKQKARRLAKVELASGKGKGWDNKFAVLSLMNTSRTREDLSQ